MKMIAKNTCLIGFSRLLLLVLWAKARDKERRQSPRDRFLRHLSPWYHIPGQSGGPCRPIPGLAWLLRQAASQRRPDGAHRVCRMAQGSLRRFPLSRVHQLFSEGFVCTTADTAQGGKRLSSGQIQANFKATGTPLWECRTRCLEDCRALVITPNFFLVGASKAGTTSLAQALGNHPDIFITNPKEPNFFDRLDREGNPSLEELNTYLNLYSTVTNERVIGEASVSYMSSTKAIQHIQSLYPNSKIPASLRNPLGRICSLYEMYVRHGLEQPFSYTIRVDPWLLNQCLYYGPIKRILENVPSKNVLFINFSDLAEIGTIHYSSFLDFFRLIILNQTDPFLGTRVAYLRIRLFAS